jgi:hypothetical protein
MGAKNAPVPGVFLLRVVLFLQWLAGLEHFAIEMGCQGVNERIRAAPQAAGDSRQSLSQPS